MASSSSHCVPHTKTRFCCLGYPVVHVVRLILPQLFFFFYLTLPYRHLNSLTPRTLISTPLNKFIHGPYLAFITIYNCLPFESLNINYFTLWESLPVSSVCLIPNTAFYIINVSNSWRIIFYTNLSVVSWSHFFLHQVHLLCLYWLFSYSYFFLLPFYGIGFARTWLWIAPHPLSNVVASYNSHFSNAQIVYSTDYRTFTLSQKVLLDSNALSKQLTFFSSTLGGEEYCWLTQNNYVVGDISAWSNSIVLKAAWRCSEWASSHTFCHHFKVSTIFSNLSSHHAHHIKVHRY